MTLAILLAFLCGIIIGFICAFIACAKLMGEAVAEALKKISARNRDLLENIKKDLSQRSSRREGSGPIDCNLPIGDFTRQ